MIPAQIELIRHLRSPKTTGDGVERDLQVQLRPEDEEVDNHQELLVLQGDGGVARVHHFLEGDQAAVDESVEPCI